MARIELQNARSNAKPLAVGGIAISWSNLSVRGERFVISVGQSFDADEPPEGRPLSAIFTRAEAERIVSTLRRMLDEHTP